MAAEQIDYEAVIADLEARREAANVAFDQAIGSIRKVLSLALPLGTVTVTPVSTQGSSVGLTPDAFFGLNLVEAAKKYLRLVRSPLGNKEIADGLEAVGYHHTSKDFANTLGTALWRAEQAEDSDIYREGRKWYLSEWYPGRRRKKALQEVPETETGQAANDE